MRDIIDFIIENDMSEVNMEDILMRIGEYLFEKAQDDSKIVDFNKKKKDKAKEELAIKINKMFLSGETDKVKQTPNGTLIGDPDTVQRLNSMKKELEDLNKEDK